MPIEREKGVRQEMDKEDFKFICNFYLSKRLQANMTKY